MVAIEFHVKGFRPPKKDGANSMWSHADEEQPLYHLRKEAFEEKKKTGCMIFVGRTSLELRVFSPNLEKIGDLDNFIAGVCDGLQAAKPSVWGFVSGRLAEDIDIDFRKPLLILDDSGIVSIKASKHEGTQLSYSVRLEDIVDGENNNSP